MSTATLPGTVGPTAEQREAIDRRDRDVFLEAGAGTGKTTVLVRRYVDAVTADGVEIDRILAFTFTDRAAAELRARVRSELSRRADSEQGEDRTRLRRLARDSERSWITTIHGFCRRLLAGQALGAGLDPGFAVLAEAEARRLADRALVDAVEGLVAAGDRGVRRIAAAYSHRSLAAAVIGTHERLRSQGLQPPAVPDPGPPVRSANGDPPEALTPSEADAAREGMAAFAALVSAFADRYAALKASRSAVDFEDLQLLALEVLRGRGGNAWRERFDHLLVDEFQDTNRVQLALVDALRGPATRLFTVGDEAQAIYRFRHADVEVFRERRTAVDADPAAMRLPLRGNFRSSREVLAAVNLVGETLVEGFVPLTAGVEREAAGEPTVELVLTEAPRSGEATWRAHVEELDPPPSGGRPESIAEARLLARRLRELADAGVPRGDMVVLLRAFTHVDAFDDALRRAGLDPYVVGGHGYWSEQPVEDALCLLAVVANPLDDHTLFGALASPACAVSADALWLLRDAAGAGRHVWPVIGGEEWPGALDDEDAARLREFRATVERLRRDAPVLPLPELVERVVEAFDYDLAVLAKPAGRQRLANLRKLERLAREFEAAEGRDLRGFLAFAEERTVRDEREGQAAIRVEGHDGVRVMTVHAAKGLEFPVVAVADLGRALSASSWAGHLVVGRVPPGGGQAAVGLRLTLPDGLQLKLWDLVDLEARERREDAEESCRLAYVAASRAKERLILSGTYAPGDLEPCDSRDTESALRRLLPRLRDLGWDGEDGTVRIPPVAGESDEPVMSVRVSRPSSAAARALRLIGMDQAEPSVQPLEVPPPLVGRATRRFPVGHLSYSALDLYGRCSYRYYAERMLGLPPFETDEAGLGGARGLAIGNAVHSLLEWSARRSWREPGPNELAAALAVAGAAGEPGATATVSEMVNAWLGSDSLAELRAGGFSLRPEVPFAVELGGTIVRGKIDLLAEREGEITVVDYKTNALAGTTPREVAMRYRVQRDVYAVAAATHRPAATRLTTVYSFLRAVSEPVTDAHDTRSLADARTRLEGLIAAIRAGRFHPAERPDRPLCAGCPASANLCPRAAWRP